jgi:hypothetical protein
MRFKTLGDGGISKKTDSSLFIVQSSSKNRSFDLAQDRLPGSKIVEKWRKKCRLI